MKKSLHHILILMLVCSMLSGLLTACTGSKNPINNSTGTEPVAAESTEVPQEALKQLSELQVTNQTDEYYFISSEGSAAGNASGDNIAFTEEHFNVVRSAGAKKVSSVGIYEITEDATTVEIDTDGDGAKETWKVIRTLADLPTEKEVGGRYILANDIDCGGMALSKTTIQLGIDSILEGNGFGILNFYTKTDSDENGKSGIFTLGTGGLIAVRNLHFGTADAPVSIDNNLVCRSGDESADEITLWENVDAYVNITREDGGYPGTFFSTSKGMHTFKDCDVIVYSCAATNSDSNVGGFIGQTTTDSKPLTFINCTIAGNMVCGANCVGGFIGRVELSEAMEITMTNCKNYLDVSANLKAGGFIGFHYSTTKLTFTDCINYGNMNSNEASGGFVGKNSADTSFTNCSNYGAVSAASYAGGFLGQSEKKKNIFVNCFNKGDVIVSSNAMSAGGFCGEVAKGQWSDCTNIGNITIDTEAVAEKQFGCGNLAGVATDWEVSDCYAYGSVNGANATKGVLFGIGAEVGTTSGNKFIMKKNNDENLLGAEADGRVDAATAVSDLNDRYSDCKFMVGDDDIPVLAAPILKDVQNTEFDEATNTQKIRFVGVIDTLNYKELGFKFNICYTDSNGVEQVQTDRIEKCSEIFDSIQNVNSDDTNLVSASAMGGKYIFSLSFSDVPANVGEVVIEVTPFAVATGEGAAEYIGETVKVIYNDGMFISSNKVIAE